MISELNFWGECHIIASYALWAAAFFLVMLPQLFSESENSEISKTAFQIYI